MEPAIREIREFISTQTCPVCHAGPFKVLAIHTQQMHGISALSLREAAGLMRKSRICDDDYAARCVERGRSEDRSHLVYRGSANYTLSPAGLKSKREAAREQAKRTTKLKLAKSEGLYVEAERLFREGLSYGAIGRQLGRSREGIKKILVRRGAVQ